MDSLTRFQQKIIGIALIGIIASNGTVIVSSRLLWVALVVLSFVCSSTALLLAFTPSAKKKKKYKNSQLSDERKRVIYRRIIVIVCIAFGILCFVCRMFVAHIPEFNVFPYTEKMYQGVFDSLLCGVPIFFACAVFALFGLLDRNKNYENRDIN